jgi:hypothetical protein
LNAPTNSRDRVWLAALRSALSRRADAERLVGDRLSRLEEAESLAARQAELLAEVESSVSWRITAPLRWLKGKWRELRDRKRGEEDSPDAAQVTEASPPELEPILPSGSALEGSPWRAQQVPQEVLEVPSMITADERRLLYWLARHYFSGEGTILDAGCYLGGSTLALAAGLRDRGDSDHAGRPIFSYDIFRVDEGMTPDLPSDAGLKEGDSFRPLFEENLGECLRYCTVLEGNILDHGWAGDGPIEIAFIDLLKTSGLNDFAVETFFGEFIPGRTILVHQDFVHEFCPWIHVTMGYFDPYFELLDLFDFGSAVYLLREPIPPEALRISIENDLPADEKIMLMDRAITPMSGEMRGIVECAKACLLHQLAGPQAMDAHLRYVEARYEASDQVLKSVAWTRSMYRRGGGPGGGPDTFHVPEPIEQDDAADTPEARGR